MDWGAVLELAVLIISGIMLLPFPGGHAADSQTARYEAHFHQFSTACVDHRISMFSLRRLAAEVRRTGARLASGVPERDARFASVQDADLRFFESVLGGEGVVTDPHELAPFNK